MPHDNHLSNHYQHNNNDNTLLPSSSSLAAAARRLHVLFTLSSEVLAVAERLDDADARRRWAGWADAVFLQMHMEADVDNWRARVGVARGRCWLVIGSARADEMEDTLERGDSSVLLGKEAEDAKASLSTGELPSHPHLSFFWLGKISDFCFDIAISFFDRAKRSASTESSEPSLVNMQPWVSLFSSSHSCLYL